VAAASAARSASRDTISSSASTRHAAIASVTSCTLGIAVMVGLSNSSAPLRDTNLRCRGTDTSKDLGADLGGPRRRVCRARGHLRERARCHDATRRLACRRLHGVLRARSARPVPSYERSSEHVRPKPARTRSPSRAHWEAHPYFRNGRSSLGRSTPTWVRPTRRARRGAMMV